MLMLTVHPFSNPTSFCKCGFSTFTVSAEDDADESGRVASVPGTSSASQKSRKRIYESITEILQVWLWHKQVLRKPTYTIRIIVEKNKKQSGFPCFHNQSQWILSRIPTSVTFQLAHYYHCSLLHGSIMYMQNIIKLGSDLLVLNKHI